MSQMEIAVPTSAASMAEIRPLLDRALATQFPGGLLKWSWIGDTMSLTGPGATATIVLEPGRLVGRADLKPPASLMKPVIESKVLSAMREVAAAFQ